MKICGAFVQLHPRPKFDSFPLAYSKDKEILCCYEVDTHRASSIISYFF